MFGYVTINKAEMKFKEFDIYHSFYCGLCRVLKDKYGISGQLTLSYDMTFILILLTELYEPETKYEHCKCLAHPFENHEVRYNFLTEYIADMNVLFTYYKCMDDWEDDRKLHKLLFGKLLEGKTGKSKEVYIEKTRNINLLMHDMNEAEKNGKEDIDAMAGLF